VGSVDQPAACRRVCFTEPWAKFTARVRVFVDRRQMNYRAPVRQAAHESPRTTKLYDRTKERLTQDEVEKIRL
jgi:hypothetical protein